MVGYAIVGKLEENVSVMVTQVVSMLGLNLVELAKAGIVFTMRLTALGINSSSIPNASFLCIIDEEQLLSGEGAAAVTNKIGYFITSEISVTELSSGEALKPEMLINFAEVNDGRK